MRRKNDGRALGTDGGDDFVDRAGGVGGLGAAADLACLEHGDAVRDAAHVENLRPAEAEPAVADDHHPLIGGELAGHGFHAE